MQFNARTLAIAVAIATGVVVLAGCSTVPLSPDMRMGAAPQQPAPPVAASSTPFTAVERDFVTKVAARAVYEIEVSKLAAERALSPSVRDYAVRLAQDDTQMNDELIVLMAAHGVSPPRGLPADKATKLHRLASLPRSDAFDNGYIRVVGIEDGRKAVAMLEKARSQVRDRDLRAWIERSLTIARTHVSRAQTVAASLGG